MKIGFPRALYYFDYFPFWAGFFHRLGIEVVTSPPTHRQIMEQGLKKASDETCLPLKLMAGHIQALNDVDAIFLPRMVSVEEGTYSCPKFLGIPESLLPAVPPGMPVLTVVLNWRKGKRQVLKDLQEFGTRLGKNRSEIRKAFSEAQEWQKRYQDSKGAGWNFEDSLRQIERATKGLTMSQSVPKSSSIPSITAMGKDTERLRISLVGHSYLTLESYANLDILRRLREKAEVELSQHVNQEDVNDHLQGLRKKLFWSHAKQIFGSGNKFVKDRQVDGVIYLSCFGCGIDSMVQEMMARSAREQHKPYMVVTLDEHSGEVGLVTRLEAFLDMVERRKIHEGNVSTYGERLDRDSNTL
ncbi:MAG TPA: acyl-CoA dehydratase activase-related protein [Desulfosporosinus sp.]|nr:acyl-CoA dehydratase activase-related protein [Desulfosporosinus sp.]